jgi:hypothetical protein
MIFWVLAGKKAILSKIIRLPFRPEMFVFSPLKTKDLLKRF